MKAKKIMIFSFAIFMAISLTTLESCSSSDDLVNKRNSASTKLLKRKHKIKIAFIDTPRMEFYKEGADLAVEEINSAGGILGAKIELVYFNDEDNFSVSNEIAYKIGSDNQICALIGHSPSNLSIFNSPIYHYYGVLMFSPMSSSIELTAHRLPYVFRNVPSNEELGNAAVKLCKNLKLQRIMILNENTVYARDLANSFELYSGSYNIKSPDREIYEEDFNYNSYIEIVKYWKNNYNFDGIFIAGNMPYIGEIVTMFRENDINVPIIGGETFDVPSFFLVGSNKTENNFYCVSNFDLGLDTQPFNHFKENFYQKYNALPNLNAFQSYDAVKVVAKAIEKSGSVRVQDIANTLRSEKVWNECGGPYSFDEYGNAIGTKIFVKKANNGEFQVLDY